MPIKSLINLEGQNSRASADLAGTINAYHSYGGEIIIIFEIALLKSPHHKRACLIMMMTTACRLTDKHDKKKKQFSALDKENP